MFNASLSAVTTRLDRNTGQALKPPNDNEALLKATLMHLCFSLNPNVKDSMTQLESNEKNVPNGWRRDCKKVMNDLKFGERLIAHLSRIST